MLATYISVLLLQIRPKLEVQFISVGIKKNVKYRQEKSDQQEKQILFL